MIPIFQKARLWAILLLAILAPATLSAAPFAAYVIDARTGQPIYRQNEDTRLHPASLTKMMTLYMAFTAVERGQVRLDSQFPVSSNAASEPPSKLGLRAGQRIELRYLIRAAAIKSANDAATTIGEGLAGSEEAFARQMTQMARALGMRNTNFRNAHGLTQEGHYSTAHDMTILGRRLFYDFPQYYNIFSRRSADAGIAQVASTNKRFLDSYQGADGIKTGYTRAAGFNLTASAQRGNKRLVATVLGGTSTAHRNQVMAQLLDAGFNRVPNRVREVRPEAPNLLAQRVVRRAQVEPSVAATQPDPQRLVLSASAPPVRVSRSAAASTAAIAQAPAAPVPAEPEATGGLSLAASARPASRPGTAVAAAPAVSEAAPQSASLAAPVLSQSVRPARAPRSRSASTAATLTNAAAEPAAVTRAVAEAMPQDGGASLSLLESPAPKPRSETVILAAMGEGDVAEPEALEIVSRAANSGRGWGVTLGMFKSKTEAERLLLRSALQDGAILNGAARHVADTKRGFQPSFANLTKANAQLVCERFASRSQECSVVGQ
ncbi:D-alanyl-D-alanine carboxypeptidase family protein [Paracoccus benzoatiresistens]|uniref:D-alanyl-D-alanine carboxypeptidase n=1 Tax=Paracoccus benzoatiresistens TaxID=2997341 RepID=A0ABT4J4Q4_9RHOB|nr:D-alanyl-D-alanine carboxypeptidase family protein [Paracoccus sp. EF6]MCZ0961625.1 D-alanyl-D-alanine carboxypeptidase [Paracoccus sp. EF6]